MRLAVSIIGAVLVGAMALIVIVGPGPKKFRAPDTELQPVFSTQLRSFTATNPSQEARKELEAAQQRYSNIRKQAVNKIEKHSLRRDILSYCAHGFSGLVLLSSFLISFFAAGKGLQVSASPTKEELKSFGRNHTALRKRIFVLSAISVLATGAADRTATYSSKIATTGKDLVANIEKADADVTRALGLADVDTAAKRLELVLAND